MKKNTFLVSIGSKEAGKEMDGDKIKWLVLFRVQDSGQIHYIEIDTCNRVRIGPCIILIFE